MNMAVAAQLLWAAVGSLGFCLLFNVRARRIPHILVGAVITWLLYVAVESARQSVFTCSLVAAVFATIYCEVLAHRLKAPVTAFLMPVLVPLIPGGGLYNTVYNLIVGDENRYRQYMNDTAMTCLGIVLGITGVLFVIQYWKGRRKK
ncbi:MAG: threonine/serine exporter family protein [Clostridia bacterium]|nr:threonine/serine exporter family protein [Clostridia bacterium]